MSCAPAATLASSHSCHNSITTITTDKTSYLVKRPPVSPNWSGYKERKEEKHGHLIINGPSQMLEASWMLTANG